MSTFNQKLSKEEELATYFFDLYGGLDRAHGRYKPSGGVGDNGKVKGRAETVQADYNVRLWLPHFEGTQGLGVIPIRDDGTCSWGAIDIDVYPLDLEKLEDDIKRLNLPLMVVKTKSGGAHCTIYFAEPVSAKLVRQKLYEFSIALGYPGVEIFPKQHMLASKSDVGNWLNMPYFDLANTTRYGIHNHQPLAVRDFLDLAYKIRITEDQLRAIEVSLEGDFDDGPPCLQMIAKAGVPEGTRNNTVFAMGVYAKLKFDDDWEEKLIEMNAKYVNPPLKAKETQLITRSLARKDYFYPCNKSPLINHCNKELCRKREYGIGTGNDEFSLMTGSLTKITTEPPIWIMDVEGIRVQLDTEDLISQDRFRRACMMNINKLPPRVKTPDWEKLVREKLENVEIIDAPDESRRSSRINQYAYQFLANTPPAQAPEDVRRGRPYLDKPSGYIVFQGNDLIRYLDNNGIKAEARAIWSSLRDTGAEHGVLELKNGGKLQVWKIKKDMVPELNFDIDTPDFDAF